MVLVGFQVWTK